MTKYALIGLDGKPYSSNNKGLIGGNRRSKIFGRLDCLAALRAIELGGYVRNRVFFADMVAATRAGYRPCALCLPDLYRRWKERQAKSNAPHRAPG